MMKMNKHFIHLSGFADAVYLSDLSGSVGGDDLANDVGFVGCAVVDLDLSDFADTVDLAVFVDVFVHLLAVHVSGYFRDLSF